MAPTIPTCRPVLNATRLAVTVAVLAMASSVYLAFGAPLAMASPSALAVPVEQSCSLNAAI